MTLIGLLILLAAILNVGCASMDKNIRVIQSKSEINVKHFDVDNGDTLICDVDGCRKLK